MTPATGANDPRRGSYNDPRLEFPDGGQLADDARQEEMAERAWQNYSDGVACGSCSAMGSLHVHEAMQQSDGKWYIGACKLCACESRYGEELSIPDPALQHQNAMLHRVAFLAVEEARRIVLAEGWTEYNHLALLARNIAKREQLPATPDDGAERPLPSPGMDAPAPDERQAMPAQRLLNRCEEVMLAAELRMVGPYPHGWHDVLRDLNNLLRPAEREPVTQGFRQDAESLSALHADAEGATEQPKLQATPLFAEKAAALAPERRPPSLLDRAREMQATLREIVTKAEACVQCSEPLLLGGHHMNAIMWGGGHPYEPRNRNLRDLAAAMRDNMDELLRELEAMG